MRTPESEKARKRAYYLANIERIKAEAKANREAKRAYMVEWRRKNAEAIKAKAAAYREAHREELNAQAAEYARRNPEKRREVMRRRYAADPGYFLFNQITQRAKRAGVHCDLSRDEYEAVRAEHGGVCAECKREAKLTLDHIRPLSKGGPHVRSNIQFLCKPCNSRKSDREPAEVAA